MNDQKKFWRQVTAFMLRRTPMRRFGDMVVRPLASSSPNDRQLAATGQVSH